MRGMRRVQQFQGKLDLIYLIKILQSKAPSTNYISHIYTYLEKKCFLTNNKFWLKRMLLSNWKIYEIANSVIDAVQMTQKFLISIVIPQLGQIFWHLHFHDKGRKFSELQPIFFENRTKFWNNHKHRFCNFSL